MARWLVALWGLVGAGLLAACAPAEAPQRIVLVTLDTLRHDRVFGAEGAMPRLRARAERGTVFDRAFSASSTTQPTHASLLTGLHPWQHGVTRNGQRLPEEIETLPERLAAAGFETRAVVASYPVAAEFGFGQGFQEYREDFTEGLGARVWEGHALPTAGFFTQAETLTDRALASLDAAGAPRQFFWFHYFDPHSPYGHSDGPGGGWMESDVHARVEAGESREAVLAELRARYAQDVAYLDRHLERLLDRLERDTRRIETHVVVTADHGESLGEGGVVGHGYGLADVEVHVPTLIFSPALPPGVRREPVGSVDLAATLLARAGLAPERGEGRDVFAAALPEAEVVGMRRTFATRGVGERLLDGRVRPIPDLLFYLVPSREEGAAARALGNARWVRGAAPGARTRIQERFRDFEQELALARSRGDDAPDPETEARLRALGYTP